VFTPCGGGGHQPQNKKDDEHSFRVSSEDEEEFIQCRVGDREIPLIIDSGCRFNLISHEDCGQMVKGKASLLRKNPFGKTLKK